MADKTIDLNYIEAKLKEFTEKEIGLRQQLQQAEQQLQMLQANLISVQSIKIFCENLKKELMPNEQIKLAEIPK
jgi:hypothetical protein